MKIYIQSNKFQNLAANVSKYSFERFGYEVKIMSLEENKLLYSQLNKKILRKGKISKYKNDLQSFTFLRFLAPELDKNDEMIMVIDPDIFAIKDPKEILNHHNKNSDISCTFYNEVPRSEMMLINSKKIKWNFNEIIKNIFNLNTDYFDLMNLTFDNDLNINELDKKFNMHDIIDEDTVLLHTTNRITQPWKINLQIDFERYYTKRYLMREKLKKVFNREYDNYALSDKYMLHNNKSVINLVQELFKEAYSNNSISKEMINISLANNYISREFCEDCGIC